MDAKRDAYLRKSLALFNNRICLMFSGLRCAEYKNLYRRMASGMFQYRMLFGSLKVEAVFPFNLPWMADIIVLLEQVMRSPSSRTRND